MVAWLLARKRNKSVYSLQLLCRQVATDDCDDIWDVAPAGCGEAAAQGCPRLASAETGAVVAGEVQGVEHRREASVCLARQSRSKGPFGPLPASLHLSPGRAGV